MSNGVEKIPPAAIRQPGAKHAIGAPSPQISLVGLLPSRARLRFSGHNYDKAKHVEALEIFQSRA